MDTRGEANGPQSHTTPRTKKRIEIHKKTGVTPVAVGLQFLDGHARENQT